MSLSFALHDHKIERSRFTYAKRSQGRMRLSAMMGLVIEKMRQDVPDGLLLG